MFLTDIDSDYLSFHYITLVCKTAVAKMRAAAVNWLRRCRVLRTMKVTPEQEETGELRSAPSEQGDNVSDGSAA